MTKQTFRTLAVITDEFAALLATSVSARSLAADVFCGDAISCGGKSPEFSSYRILTDEEADALSLQRAPDWDALPKLRWVLLEGTAVPANVPEGP